MNRTFVKDGNVVLISAGDRVYTDMAAKFVDGESLDQILSSDYNRKEIPFDIIELPPILFPYDLPSDVAVLADAESEFDMRDIVAESRAN